LGILSNPAVKPGLLLDTMVSKELQIKNETGIHARPAAVIVEVANRYNADIYFTKDGVRANVKSIMNILFLAVEPGSTLLVEAQGSDEVQALEAINKLFKDNFSDGAP
jgi:phosphocarrier protein